MQKIINALILLVRGLVIALFLISPIEKNNLLAPKAKNLGKASIPQTGIAPTLFESLANPAELRPVNTTDTQEFREFVKQVSDGYPGIVRGVYVEDVLALPIIQQPEGKNAFVSEEWNMATQFSDPAKYGITGLLAHNYLSGQEFFELELGMQVRLVYGDGLYARYRVTEIQRYQKLNPNSLSSQMIDQSSGKEMSTNQVFKKVYMGEPHITFQTCIKKGSNWSWGLIFILAEPMDNGWSMNRGSWTSAW